MLERSPPAGTQVVSGRRNVKEQQVQATVTSLADYVGGSPGVLAESPRSSPGRDVAGFKSGNDLCGDLLTKLFLHNHD